MRLLLYYTLSILNLSKPLRFKILQTNLLNRIANNNIIMMGFVEYYKDLMYYLFNEICLPLYNMYRIQFDGSFIHHSQLIAVGLVVIQGFCRPGESLFQF